MVKKVIIILLLLLSLISCARTDNITTTLWEPVEFELNTDNNQRDPYWAPEITGTFYHDSDTIVINGFWYGENLYRLRFTPVYEGQWEFRITGSGKLLKKGTIHVSGPVEGNHGFIRRDKKYPYHFIMDDGTRYFLFGTTYYNMVLNAFAGERWKTAIDSAKIFGINKIRIFASSSGSSKTPYPWVSPYPNTGDSLDYRHINSEYWKALDRIVQYSFEKGMTVDLIMFGYGKETYSTPLLDKRYAQYVLARYAAYPNVIWCLVNEWNYIYRDHKRDKPFWNSLGELVHAEDPYIEFEGQFRPLSIHQQTRPDFQFFNYEWPVHAIVQLGVRNGQVTVKDEWDNSNPEFKPATRNGDEWGNYSIALNLGHDMPVVNDEFGYIGEPQDRSEATGNDRSEWPAFTREKHRNVMSGIYLAGGYGSAGDKNSYNDGSPYFSANWHSDPPEYHDIKVLTDFFRSGDIEYWKMKSVNEIIISGNRVYALGEKGRQYLIYSAAGNKISATIEPGEYQVWVIDPITGLRTEQEKTRGGEINVDPGIMHDWVLFIKLVDSTL